MSDILKPVTMLRNECIKRAASYEIVSFENYIKTHKHDLKGEM